MPSRDPRELYGLPLERFTAERNALARELRRDGKGDEAAAVAKLRKPSVAAWAVNQLVRTQRAEVASLFESGGALRRAQADLVGGRGEGEALRRAVESERAAVQRLTEKARGLLSSEGHELSAQTLNRVTETLHAAALDEEARARAQDGCLDRELRHVGLGTVAGSSSRRPKGSRAPRDEGRAARPASARRAEAEARREMELATRRLELAEERHERAGAELRDAEQALERARELAEEAIEAHRRAKGAREAP